MARHRYGTHRDQHGSLRLPAGGGGRHPVAVLLHGGSWQDRYGSLACVLLQRDLARRGWAAWNLEYRRLGRSSGGGWPQTGADVLAGVDRLATIDAPLDLGRVVLIGHSAGGQLALYAAGGRRDGDAAVRVSGVVAQAAPSDLRRSALHGAPTIEAFLGGSPDVVPDHYREASPIERVPLGVPQLLVHGDADRVVGFGTSKRYADAARAAGDDVTLARIPGAGHLAHLNPRGEAWGAALDWLERWEPRG